MNHIAEIQKILIGLPESHVWRGYGSALFLEFGKLTKTKRHDGSPGNPMGEISLMIEWSWRIENPPLILAGSWSSQHKWPKAFRSLAKARVMDVSFVSALPELQLALSNGKRVSSFMTAEGQPAWAIISRTRPLGSWSVKSGAIAFTKTPLARSLTGHALRHAG